MSFESDTEGELQELVQILDSEGKMEKLLELITTRCQHRNVTWPRSTAADGSRRPTYIRCNECGEEIPYNFERLGEIKVAN